MIEIESKGEGKYHESIHSSITPDAGHQWESDKTQENVTH